MKKIFFAILILAFATFNLTAQDDGYYEGDYNDEDSRETLNYTTSLGAQLMWGGGFSWPEAYPGYNSPVSLNNLPDITAIGYLPLSSQIKFGILGEVGLLGTSYASAPENNTKNIVTTQIKYIVLGAAVYYSGIYMGLNYGFPIAGSRNDNNESTSIASEAFVKLIDFKLGYDYPIWEDPAKGRLNFVAQVNFTMAGLLTNDLTVSVPKPGDEYNVRRYNFQPLQFKIGLNYFFNMAGFSSY
jgi:hypothetical protein